MPRYHRLVARVAGYRAEQEVLTEDLSTKEDISEARRWAREMLGADSEESAEVVELIDRAWGEAGEILDSRSRPTVAVTVGLEGGVVAHAGVPSGASTGTREAKELSDGDPSRFEGRGVTKAVGHVGGEIADQIVGVSIAVARAVAQADGKPLWKTLTVPGAEPRLPVPHVKVVNGRVHATNRLDFQEFMIAPLGAPSEAEAVRAGSEIYGALRRILADRRFATGLGDEGGFAPELDSPEEVLAVLGGGHRTGRLPSGTRRGGAGDGPGLAPAWGAVGNLGAAAHHAAADMDACAGQGLLGAEQGMTASRGFRGCRPRRSQTPRRRRR